MSKVSIIIPVYNKAPYLEQCLNSVINQTYKNLEIIIIDDGSTDNSLEICEKYRKKDERIQLISQENQGVSVARNKGIQKASGEWIYFLDADDYLDIDTFQTILVKKSHYSGVNLIHFGIRARKVSKEIIREKRPTNKVLTDKLTDFLSALELRPVSCCLYLIYANIIKNNNMFFDVEQKTGEDKIFIYEVFMRATNYLILDSVFYNQVLSPGSLSRTPVSKEKILSNLSSQEKIIKISKKLNSVESMKPEINRGLRSFFGGLLHYSIDHKIDKEIKREYYKFQKRNKDVFSTTLALVSRWNLDLVIFCYKVYNLFLTKVKLR